MLQSLYVFTSICCECVCVHSFYEDLVFYDKDNIPEDIFLKIEERVNKPKFRVCLINALHFRAIL